MRGERGAGLEEIEAVYRGGYEGYVGVALAIVRDAELARDAVQEAFANAVRRRADFRGDGPSRHGSGARSVQRPLQAAGRSNR